MQIMNSWKSATISSLTALAIALTAVACSDDDSGPDPMGGVDASPQPDPDPDPEPVVFTQIEQLARPGIAEALLITPGFLAGFNAGSPTFEGFDATTVDAVVGEAKVVLKAIYLGSCLLNGALGLAPANGVHPAGIECHAVGGALFDEDSIAGVALTAASSTASQAYADKVVGQFLPDVMRIDTERPSGYLSLCGDANSIPLLCGGRALEDDVIDITYNYLINGAGTPTNGTFDQVNALTGDGVVFAADGANRSNVSAGDSANPNQGHPLTSATFPYSAAPL